MAFFADLHIHSHYSIATSRQLYPEYLDAWARLKGITVVGTGDFTHPGWLSELTEKLEPAGGGLYKLRQNFQNRTGLPQGLHQTVRFILSSEISTIYKRDGKVRKVHHVILVPDFECVRRLSAVLDRIGNLKSDGRPILGLDSRRLLEICLDISEHICFIPAHIWTPWFSVLGSQSGFDSIEDCYGDMSTHIFAVETGLSTDPPMHWMCRFLDRFTLVSNSDAHSPDRMGRNGNIFGSECSFEGMMDALKHPEKGKFLGTVDLFPQEGKYHYDGHRKCEVCWNPLETLRQDGICLQCGKQVTVGVLHRVAELSDRDDISTRPRRLPYRSIIPLKELLSETIGTGPNSKRVANEYIRLTTSIAPEMDLLLNVDEKTIQRDASPLLAEAVRRMRERRVHIQEGYDGSYGQITVFQKEEKFGDLSLFASPSISVPSGSIGMTRFSMREYRKLRKAKQVSTDSDGSFIQAGKNRIELTER